MRDPSQNVPISYGEKHGHQYQFLFVIGGESIGSRRVGRYQRGNQNPYIEEEQTT